MSETPDVPRIRTLKPEHLAHRKIARLSDRAYRLWVGLVTQADDDGRFVADTGQLGWAIFPGQRRLSPAAIETALGELTAVGLITLYGLNGTRYGAFPSWADHQRISHPTSSRLPAPEDAGTIPNPPEFSSPARARGSEGIGREGKGREVGLRPTACRLLRFLNEKAGRSFRETDTTLGPILARLRGGATEEDGRAVIARKVREWKTDPKMSKFLRPSTLFNATHFEDYLGEAPPDAG